VKVKRKWERIVNRGFGRANTPTATEGSTSSSAMLEGIREGMEGVSKGVSRLLAELAPMPVATTPPRRRHSAHHSTSSVGSGVLTPSSSARLSQSSASSVGEGPFTPLQEEECQELVVHDTGTTPTTSPHPAVVQQQDPPAEGKAKSSATAVAKELQRRKSLEIAESPTSESASTSPFVTLSDESQLSLPPRRTTNAASKRASVSALPPPSSIPGLGSLTAGGGSWVGSATKKWEELSQRSSTCVPQTFVLWLVH
jgi:hypothetical protein